MLRTIEWWCHQLHACIGMIMQNPRIRRQWNGKIEAENNRVKRLQCRSLAVENKKGRKIRMKIHKGESVVIHWNITGEKRQRQFQKETIHKNNMSVSSHLCVVLLPSAICPVLLLNSFHKWSLPFI